MSEQRQINRKGQWRDIVDLKKVFWLVEPVIGFLDNQFVVGNTDKPGYHFVSPAEIPLYLEDSGDERQLMGDYRMEFFKTRCNSSFIIKKIIHRNGDVEWHPMSNVPEKKQIRRPRIIDSKRDGSVLFDPDKFKIKDRS